MKQCIACKGILPLSSFAKDSTQKDGLYYYCRGCKSISAKKEYQRNKEGYFRRCYAWRKTENGKNSLRKTYRSQCAKNPEKYAARSILNQELRKGTIAKPLKCESCGKEKRLAAHHDDYSKPLSVTWLCYTCHGGKHKKARGNPKILLSIKYD